MKNKKVHIFIFFMLVIFMFLTTVSAESISATDVSNSTYIIGKHMYNRETNGDYNGRLTTQYIMLGASTINSNDIGEFIIYYKTASGEWKNALTNQTVSAPVSFNIEYTNGEQTVLLKYGDLDCNGVINNLDSVALMRYLAGYTTPDEINTKNGDVNGDGKVTEADSVLLIKYLAGDYPDASLPTTPLGETHILEYVIDHGSSFETFKIDYELDGMALRDPGNPVKEGYTFEGWYKEVDYRTKVVFGTTEAEDDLILYAKFVPND